MATPGGTRLPSLVIHLHRPRLRHNQRAAVVETVVEVAVETVAEVAAEVTVEVAAEVAAEVMVAAILA